MPHFVIRKRPTTHEPSMVEELAKPPSCVEASLITVWVYRDGKQVGRHPIQEVVVMGHAEPFTCKRATAALIDAAKGLSNNVDWMLTAGAGFIRVKQTVEAASAPSLEDLMGGLFGSSFPSPLSPDQKVLEDLVTELSRIAEDTGLLALRIADLEQLHQFRKRFSGSGSKPSINLPTGEWETPVADLVPIVPKGKSTPVKFHLEGWDFDTPEYQQVADRHLRTMQRELLADSLRRLRVYQGWLEEAVKSLAGKLRILPKPEARGVTIVVPNEGDLPLRVPFLEFLDKHIGKFVDGGWSTALAHHFRTASFGMMTETELDTKQIPPIVQVYDPNTLQIVKRAGTEEDASTPRQQATENAPGMVSNWLVYIKRMQAIVAPYQNLRIKSGTKQTDAEAALLDNISRQLVIETMVRDWPPLFLDEEDREVFHEWAAQVRKPIWKIMNEQVTAQGVAPEILLEENVIYEVCLNDDLGCTLQPFMVVDGTNHAWLRSYPNVGANVSIPLWNRFQTRSVPKSVLGLGLTNTQRAHALVELAAKSDDVSEIANQLRQALSCHPAEGGFAILEEWRKRLGRSTAEEFDLAKCAVEGHEYFCLGRFDEALKVFEKYLKLEPDPQDEVWAFVALCELQRASSTQKNLRLHYRRQLHLMDRAEKLRPALDKLQATMGAGLNQLEARQIELLEQAAKRIDQARDSEEARAKEVQSVREWIGQALTSPESVADAFPYLARAAQLVPAILKSVELAEDTMPNVQLSRGWQGRYGAARVAVEASGLLELGREIGEVLHLVKEGGEVERQEAFDRVEKLVDRLWLTDVAETRLRAFVDDVSAYLSSSSNVLISRQTMGRDSKKQWDAWLVAMVSSLLEDSLSDCLRELQGRLRLDSVTLECSLAETWETQIHIRQVFLRGYEEAFKMLIEPVVTFGRSQCKWEIVDSSVTDAPPGSRLEIDRISGQVFLATLDSRISLLRAVNASEIDWDYLEATLEGLLEKKATLPTTLARAVHDAVVVPDAPFQLWTSAMKVIRRELIYALSNYDFRASLFPSPPRFKSAAGKKKYEQKDRSIPVVGVEVDWEWKDLGFWAPLLQNPPEKAK